MSMKIFSDFLPSFLDSACFILPFILCLLSWKDGDENDDDAVPRGAVGVAEDMLEVSPTPLSLFFSCAYKLSLHH